MKAALSLAAATLVGAIAVIGGGGAPVVADDIDLVLDDQVFFADSRLSLEYSIVGEIVEVGPTTTTTSTTTTTTVVPLDDADTTTTTSTPDDLTGEPTDDDMADDEASVRIALHGPYTSRIDIGRALGGALGDPVDVTTRRLADLGRFDETTGERVLVIDLPLRHRGVARARDPIGLEVPADGLYAVSVGVYRGADRLAGHVTAVDIADSRVTERAPLGVSVVAVVPTPTSFDNSSTLAATREALEAIAELDAAVDVPLSVVIDPRVAEFAADGSLAAGTGVGAWAASFDGEVYALPSPELDPSTAAVSDLGDEFADYLVDGTNRTAAALPAAVVRRDIWPLEGAVFTTVNGAVLTPAGADLLRSLGIRALVSSWGEALERVEDITGSLDATTIARFAASDGLEVLTADPATSRLGNNDVDTAPLERAVRVLADWTVRRHAQPSITHWAMLSTDDLSPPDPVVAAAIIDLLGDDPAARIEAASYAIGAAAAMRSGDVPVVLTADVVAPNDLTERVTIVNQMRLRILDVASMLPDDDPRPAQWSAVVDAALSSEVDDEQAAATMAQLMGQFDELRTAVTVLDIGTVNLTGTDTPMPLRLMNSSDTPLRVVISVDSTRLLPIEPFETVVAPGETTLRVPVTPRANGRFPVEVDVASPAGGVGGVGMVITASSVSLSGLGRGVAAGLVVVLLTWWFSHFRRRRRSRLDRMRHATLTDDTGIDDTGGIDAADLRQRLDDDTDTVDDDGDGDRPTDLT